eukprot:CAMPEP_0204913286 /NCGR_PEP_ID=MMETSP1397-20131031/11217_1 /ASSEMBLY_ACC=CAM_ASM_000891 /TAXON_ID=49980 /ORGANISM="Climacostomum Climacostomum virens, Strain Stock W-24" /LENGTH=281 /DNA_ID=CAMNT_0052084489 /DNA_START=45 /DNA_END=887 /DNA_ORIENTATION=-
MSAVLELLLFLAVAFKLQYDLQHKKAGAIKKLVLCAVVLLAWNLSGMTEAHNLYTVTGIPRTTPQDKMKSAYRTASIKKHPDQNPSPNALKEYEEFQEAFAILEDKDKRLRYELYGDWNPDAEVHDGMHSASFYLAWLGVLYYLSYVEEFRGTGKWQHFVLLSVAVYEMTLKFTQSAALRNTSLTINQQAELVKSLLPFAMLLYYIFHFTVFPTYDASSSVYDPEPALKEAFDRSKGVFLNYNQEFLNQKVKELVNFRKQLKFMRKQEKNNIGGFGGKMGW